MSRRALLVGINEFQQLEERTFISPLYGCENDTELLRQTLVEHFEFEDSEIEVLKGEDATAEGIRAALGRLVDNTGYDHDGTDVRFFAISTHGTQVDAENPGEEDDELDEAFIAHDHRWEHPFRDNELKRIFDRVPEDALLTIVADTCHSGSIQALEITSKRRRRKQRKGKEKAKEPKFSQTVSRFVDNPFLMARGRSPTPRSLAGDEPRDFDIVAAPRHVLLSACAPDEESSEILVLPGGERQGALTWAFCETVKNLGSELTYEKLIAGIGDELDTLPQTPQLECPKEYLELWVLSPLGDSTDQRPPDTDQQGDSSMGAKAKSGQQDLSRARVALITYLAAYSADPGRYNKKKKRRKLMEDAGIPENLREALQSGELQKIANVVAPVFKPVRDEGGG